MGNGYGGHLQGKQYLLYLPCIPRRQLWTLLWHGYFTRSGQCQYSTHQLIYAKTAVAALPPHLFHWGLFFHKPVILALPPTGVAGGWSLTNAIGPGTGVWVQSRLWAFKGLTYKVRFGEVGLLNCWIVELWKVNVSNKRYKVCLAASPSLQTLQVG